jgi:hypothetical protein
LAAGEDFEFAFEDVEGFILIFVGVGWGSAAGLTGLDQHAGAAACHLTCGEDIDRIAEDFEALDGAQVTSICGGCRNLEAR